MGKTRKTAGEQDNTVKQQMLTELTDEEREKFEKLVVPHLSEIKQLVAYYSTNPTYFEDNYCFVLEELACYINNFDTSRMDKLKSWIHVVVKLLYPFRKLFLRFDFISFINDIGSILKQEEIYRTFH